MFDVKLPVPVLIGSGSLLYNLATGSRTILSKPILNLNTALLVPSKHSSVAFREVLTSIKDNRAIINLLFNFIFSLYI